MLLLVFWLKNRPSIKYVRNWRKGGGGVIQNVCRCVQWEGVEKSILRYVRIKWMVQNKYCGIFFVHWFDQAHRASPSARKMSLFFSIIITIISFYAIIRILLLLLYSNLHKKDRFRFS